MSEDIKDSQSAEELTNQETNTNTEEVITPEADNLTAETDNTSEQTPSIEETLAQLQDAHLRLMAEYDNYRRRTLKEKSELIKNGGEKVLIELLPVVDDLDLAVQNIEKAQDLEAIKAGIQLIQNKFSDYLSRQGVRAIPTENESFNEELHEAIAVIPAPTEEQKGQIIDCVKKGYTLNEKVIRHANVVVGQ